MIERGKPLPNGGSEPGVFFEEPVHGLLNYLHGFPASVAGKLLKLSFLFGCQMYFHIKIVDAPD
jgi:hypothetical protein